jgi:hypothetical protein
MNQYSRESVSVLSKREREQNRSLHRCSRTGRTALEQLEQVNDSPIPRRSRRSEQVGRKQGLSRGPKGTSCSNGLRTGQTGWKTCVEHPPQDPLGGLLPCPREWGRSSDVISGGHMGKMESPRPPTFQNGLSAKPSPCGNYAHKKRVFSMLEQETNPEAF